jgi:hypothetical protein
MKLDYITDFNEYGESIVRLYEFDRSQAELFKKAVHETIILKKSILDLSSLDFIQTRNCNLILQIANEDIGITVSDNEHFVCELTIQGYIQLIELLEPFCNKETRSYQWLYDIDSNIDFLFSPAGTW